MDRVDNAYYIFHATQDSGRGTIEGEGSVITGAIIPAAGMGTRLLPATKEQPKEMFPLFAPSENGDSLVKPLLQLVFEQLYDIGIRKFCFVIGRGKRVIQDHFTQDLSYLAELARQRKNPLVSDLRAFYRRLDDSHIIWVNQPSPLGFGDAVLRARKSFSDEAFIVHAGDTYIASRGNYHLRSIKEVFDGEVPEAVFVVKKMSDVSRRGVMYGRNLSPGLYLVDRVVEKPTGSSSNLAIEPVYIFRQSIFEALEKTKPGKDGEIQLTDAIHELIDSGKKVIAWCIPDSDLRLDVGDPESYWEALRLSHESCSRGRCGCIPRKLSASLG